MKEYVKERVEEKHYSNPSDYVRTLIRDDQKRRDPKRDAELEEIAIPVVDELLRQTGVPKDEIVALDDVAVIEIGIQGRACEPGEKNEESDPALKTRDDQDVLQASLLFWIGHACTRCNCPLSAVCCRDLRKKQSRFSCGIRREHT